MSDDEDEPYNSLSPRTLRDRPKKKTTLSPPTIQDRRAKRGVGPSQQGVIRERAPTPLPIDAPEHGGQLKVISMKSSTEVAADAEIRTPEVARPKLRALSDVRRGQPTPPGGHLAPPREVAPAAKPPLLSFGVWIAILAIGAVVAAAIWLLGR